MKKKVILTILVTFLLFPGFIYGIIPASERTALMAFYNYTNGDAWSNRNGWKTPPLHTDGFAMPGTEGNWYGVLVSGDHVVELSMPLNLQSSTTIPTQLSNLSDLKVLDLSSNQLGGDIPSELSNLSHLEGLFLDYNELTGSIPPELGNLSNLKNLSLGNNQLIGSIPSHLGNLANLQELVLNSNYLSGSIPPQLGNLSKLRYLYLNHNQLSGSIPSQLGNLSNLILVWLQGNQLSGSIPAELSNLSNSTDIFLFNNKLNGPIPPEFGNLSNLKILDLSFNQLSGGIPTELGNLSLLTRLSLNKNQLSGRIPSQLGNLSNLIQLLLDENQLSGAIPSQLGNLSNLYQLSLDQNQLSGSIPYQLGNLSKLQWLGLSNNQLSGEIPPELGNLGKLTDLKLSNNQLNGGIPSELGNLSKLRALRLSENQLGGSIPSQLGNLSLLWILDLSGNQLSGSIPSELGNFKYLQDFYLDHNQLSGAIPSSFTALARIYTLDIGYNCLSATDSVLRDWLYEHDPDWEVNQDQCTPKIGLNRTQLNFGIITPGSIPDAQTVLISNTGGGVLNWSVSGNAAWISVNPSSGTDDSTLYVSVDPSGLAAGNYTGTITISAPNATNSPQTITISLHVYDQGQSSVSFGEFATPLDGAMVSGSIPVTGWALDDIGVANVKIYNGDAYIGDAVLVEGARPDIEVAYPTYPNNYKAGWGYMLLTNCLPDGGNGTYTLTAKATDMEGNEIILGSKVITADNTHAVKPFGAIDTPAQGGTASGTKFINNGWALTPQPNTIPVDGSTINVVIDGVVKGHPIYNIYRWDIAWLFPGYANSNNAAGYYYLDTTKLSNGVHTIAWIVSDTEGNSDGIGSRYFSVSNIGAGEKGSEEARKSGRAEKDEFRRGAPACTPTFDEIKVVEIKELERVEINLSDKGVAPQAIRIEGYLIVGDQLRELPIGSTLDRAKGIFYWQPGPGFVGEYRLLFIGKDNDGQLTRKNIIVNIIPK